MTQSAAAPLPTPKERRRLREAKSLTQAQLAAQLGVTRETLRAWESGRTSPGGLKRESYTRLLLAPAPTPVKRPKGQLQKREKPRRSGRAPQPEPRLQETERAHASTTAPEQATPAEQTALSHRDESAERAASAKQPAVAKRGTSAKRATATRRGTSAKQATAAKRDPSARQVTSAERASSAEPASSAESASTSEPASAAEPVPAPGQVTTVGPDPSPEQVTTAKRPATAKQAVTTPQPVTRAPEIAFDALYTHAAPLLVRHAYLLCGRRALARESVERAFQLAWQRWPEVAVDPDPAGWVRAAAYEYAMSPWHRMRPALRHPDAPPAEAADRELLDALQNLPPTYRRSLLLYDWVGLDLPETAAETEASTPAAAHRVLHAREAVAERLPELAVPEQLHRRLSALAAAEKLDAPEPALVRAVGERRTRFWTRAAIVVTTLIVGATALTVRAAPTHYVPVPAPGAPISGVPPLGGPERLTGPDRALRDALRSELSGGPARLAPTAQ
ncbi:sigma factor-like helix-turn-helix DNA-binding protein [Streptomyces sp. NPDC006552]|uniref:sigma factor-like helix-turn-helix DNA-binding protein n=1 Tax=Streptomyces sp. NPDC006552 TaxID=3157179 RepID=UPI0033A90380